mmetsp:Transcript_3742/g.8067  ORF Transcript_3742/g.8067 Transcript_3742/m.8067 type:complete len:263 (-) Transcript_3742:1057-1845(-)
MAVNVAVSRLDIRLRHRRLARGEAARQLRRRAELDRECLHLIVFEGVIAPQVAPTKLHRTIANPAADNHGAALQIHGDIEEVLQPGATAIERKPAAAVRGHVVDDEDLVVRGSTPRVDGGGKSGGVGQSKGFLNLAETNNLLPGGVLVPRNHDVSDTVRADAGRILPQQVTLVARRRVDSCDPCRSVWVPCGDGQQRAVLVDGHGLGSRGLKDAFGPERVTLTVELGDACLAFFSDERERHAVVELELFVCIHVEGAEEALI